MPPPPALAEAVHRAFGDRAGLAQRYVDALATSGTERGLIGPREVDRLWERHLLDCAGLGQWCPPAGAVLDVGSGAGLPGLALAIARPDLEVTLLEPMQRRVTWLDQVVDELGLPVRVIRGRAQDTGVVSSTVTARAVAPLDRLVQWCLPLVAGGGQLLAMKGRSAAAELDRAVPELRRRRARTWEVLTGEVAPGAAQLPTTVVRVTVAPSSSRPSATPAGVRERRRRP